jgi:hypothetical protein
MRRATGKRLGTDYSPARRYQLVHDGKSYDAKAIAGVAFGHQFPERGPLHPSEFSGGDATVVPLLNKLNFDVQTIQAKGETDRADGAKIAAPQQTNPV